MARHDPEGALETSRELQAFLLRLARSLARDEPSARDLVQDTWVAALSEAPAALASPRAWLARVMRHRAINAAIGGARRSWREARVAREQAQSAQTQSEQTQSEPAECQRLLEQQRVVLAAVARLAEPYRTAIWLRYWRGLGPAAIAARQGLPLATVKARLARGRERVRLELDRRSGGERARWMSALSASVSLFENPPPSLGVGLAPIVGTLAMSAWIKGLAVTGLLVGAAVWVRSERRELPAAGLERAQPAAREVASLAPDEATSLAEARRPLRASEPPPRSESPDEPQAALAATPRLRGRVFDGSGRPLPHIELEQRERAGGRVGSAFVSGAQGAFELESSERELRIVAARAELATLVSPWVSSLAQQAELSVVVAERRALRGLVLDEAGAPLAAVALELRLPASFHTRFPTRLEGADPQLPRATSEADGSFALPDAPRVEGAALCARLEGYALALQPLPELEGEIVLTLRRSEARPDDVHGLVVDAFGRAVEGARVSFGVSVCRTDAGGRFRLRREPEQADALRLSQALAGESCTLRAIERGHLPAELRVARGPDGRAQWPDGVILELGGPGLSIAGRVRTPEGEPVAGLSLLLAEATLFSIGEGTRTLENLLGGDEDERLTYFPTDADGAFEIGGLCARDYTLLMLDPRSGLVQRSAPIPAGTRDARLSFDGARLWSHVEGRVTDVRGAPLARVLVRALVDVTEVRFEGRFIRNSSLAIGRTSTDADGRFRLVGLPKEGSYLHLSGSGVLDSVVGGAQSSARSGAQSSALGHPELDALEGLEITLHGQLLFRLALDDPGQADQIAALDAFGEPLALRELRGKPGPAQLRLQLVEGRTGVLSVSDAIVALEYYKEGALVRHRPVSLAPVEVNDL